jgi:hypothetical protein
MPNIVNEQVLTANGDYFFPGLMPGHEVLIEWDITAGSATVLPGFQKIGGTFAACTKEDGETPEFPAAGGSYIVTVPMSGAVGINVASASSLSMKAAYSYVK